MFQAFWMGISSCISRRAAPGLETWTTLNGPSHMGERFRNLASVPVLVVQRFRDLGPLQEHPSSPWPTGTATQTQGLGRSPPPPWLGLGTIHARAHSRKAR